MREIIHLSLHCHHMNDSYIKVGSDERHLSFSLVVRDKSHKTVSTNYNLFEEKGESRSGIEPRVMGLYVQFGPVWPSGKVLGW